MVRIWTDGCCLKNPGGAGGWAYVVERKGEVLDEFSGSVSATTNNKMELTAAIEAVRDAPEQEIEIVSDSSYVVKGMNIWLSKWKENGWRSGKRVIANRDLWQMLDRAVAQHPAAVRFRWVKGHAGGRFNEMADGLASKAARSHV